MKVAFIDSLFEPTVKALVGASYLIGLGYGAFLVFRNELTLGELVSFNVYLGMMIWPMFAIGELINVMRRGNASLDRVNETLSYEPDVTEPKRPAELKEPGNIVFSHVSFTYPSSTSGNIQDISFTVRKGQTVGIAGKTGSGKTTIIKRLLRQYPAGEGSITFSGVPIEQIPLDRLRGWIGYVPQDHLLFSRTVKENILYGKQDASDEEVKQAIAEAHFKTIYTCFRPVWRQWSVKRRGAVRRAKAKNFDCESTHGESGDFDFG